MKRSSSLRILLQRILFVLLLAAALPVILPAQVTTLKVGAVYTCPGGQLKIYSCSGPGATDKCDIQDFKGATPGPRAHAPRSQIMSVLHFCHLQTPAEARAAAHGGGSLQTGSNGIRVGDQVEVVTGFGWTPAKVLAINGNSYRVLADGVEVTKDYPTEVRRIGPATAEDHANGQYRLNDRVQVNIGGTWVEGKVVTEFGMDYQVEIPGNRVVWASGQYLRPSALAPGASSAPKAGVPPKPGMISCAGKIEGRYATTGSAFASFTITFRSGKATATDMGGNPEVFECWMKGEKVYLHNPEHPDDDVSMDINDDGTLQTPLGEIKKKGE